MQEYPSHETKGEKQQLSLMDLFAVMTLLALVVAPLAPLLRSMGTEQLVRALSMMGLQGTATLAAVYWQALRRKKMVSGAGRRVGVGFVTNVKWKYWPQVKCGLFFLCLIFLQILISIPFSNVKGNLLPVVFSVLIYSGQLGIATAWTVSSWLWKVYPGGVEFYEHGVVRRGTLLVPWDTVELRHSKIYPGRVVAVLPLPIQDTVVIQVDKRIKEFLTSSGLLGECEN